MSPLASATRSPKDIMNPPGNPKATAEVLQTVSQATLFLVGGFLGNDTDPAIRVSASKQCRGFVAGRSVADNDVMRCGHKK